MVMTRGAAVVTLDGDEAAVLPEPPPQALAATTHAMTHTPWIGRMNLLSFECAPPEQWRCRVNSGSFRRFHAITLTAPVSLLPPFPARLTPRRSGSPSHECSRI